MNDLQTIAFENDQVIFINQTKLPLTEEYITTDNPERIAEAIEKLEIRGAPAIGVAAGYALALSVRNISSNLDEIFNNAYQRLASTRPTAVNLFWALDRIRETYNSFKEDPQLYNILIEEAKKIHEEDKTKCENLGKNGLKVFQKKSYVLTHCNAGRLATGGSGTALSIINQAWQKGFVEMVYVDETRPLFQGSRLTAFELHKAGIPFKIITDSTAAFLMQNAMIDLVITGADRIAKNGDTANKIGTYNLAVLCNYHKIPFYIAAPTTTLDPSCNNGKEIKIELRDKKEILAFNNSQIASPEFNVHAPAFDVTPASLITAIITDEEIVNPPYNF